MNLSQRGFVYLIFFGIFCFQSTNFILKLNSIPIISKVRKIEASELPTVPVITICPHGQFDDVKLTAYGYKSQYFMLWGTTEKFPDTISWGSFTNASFGNLVQNLTDDSVIDSIEAYTDDKEKKVELEKKLMPQYGYCLEVQNFHPAKRYLTLSSPNAMDNVSVFVTDRATQSKIGPDRSTQIGDSIKISGRRIN